MTRIVGLALFPAVSPIAAGAATDVSASAVLRSTAPAAPAAPSAPRRVAERPRACQPGISRCGVDGYVERCGSDGAPWTGSMLHCH